MIDCFSRLSGRQVRVFWICLGAFGAMTGELAGAAELSEAQKQSVRQAESLLKHLESNTKLAQDAAGAGEGALTGAKAKLAASRLVGAKAALPPLMEVMAKLPAEHEQVKALQDRMAAAKATMALIQTRIEGKAEAVPAGGEGTVKLDYKQEESLKNARFILKEIEAQRVGLEKIVADIQPVKDTNTIDHRVLNQAMSYIAFARQRAGFMKNHLGNVPANGRGVAAVAEAWAGAMASIDESEKTLAPLQKQLAALVDPAGYPTLEADIKRVGEMAGIYGAGEIFQKNFEHAAALVEQSAAAKEEVSRVGKAYQALVQQKTEAGVREGKPAFFGGGIPQRMEFAQEKLGLLAALSAEAAKPVAEEMAKLRAQLKERQKALRDAIIASNELPPDRYQGGDRAKLVELAMAEWKKLQPDAEVLTVRILSEQWSRQKMWHYSNKTWGLTDASSLQAQVIVKYEKNLAVIRPINLRRDHMKNDQLFAIPMDSVKDEVIAQWLIHADKVK